MFNYRSILKQTVGKYIQNYHILEHVQWQHCENSEQNYLCWSNILTICLMLQKYLYEVYEDVYFNKRNISTYHEMYTFSFNLSFFIFTFIPL